MKKLLFAFGAAALLTVTSCEKTANNINPGSWTFMNATIIPSSCSANGNDVSAITNGGSESLAVLFGLGNSTLPTNGAYTVNSGGTPNHGNYAAIVLTVISGPNQTIYYATGGNGIGQIVNVSVSSAGNLTLTGNNIEMVASSLPHDSAALSFGISQQ